MARDEFAAVTPGEMLKEEFLAAYGLSQSQLAKAIGISPNRIADGSPPIPRSGSASTSATAPSTG